MDRKSYLPLLPAVLGLLLCATAARANPIFLEYVSVCQITDSMDVAIRWAAVEYDFKLPTRLLRDGSPVEGVWVRQADTYRDETGSGMATWAAADFCDCNVPAGAHHYKLEGVFYEEGNLDVTVEEHPAQGRTCPGLRCHEVCHPDSTVPDAGPEPPADGGAGSPADSGSPAPTDPDGTRPPQDDGKGCSLAGTAAGGPGALALMLLLLRYLHR